MKLSDQVCSIDLAKQLKELNVKQESLFYWVNNILIPIITPNEKEIFKHLTDDIFPQYLYSAFTVSELGEMLPHEIKNKYLQIHKDHEGFSISYKDCNNQIHYFGKYDPNEANSRAKMLVYLLENGLIKNDD